MRRTLTFFLALLSVFFALPIHGQGNSPGSAAGVGVNSVPLSEIACNNVQACIEAIDTALAVLGPGTPGSPIVVELPDGNVVSTDLSNLTFLTANPIVSEAGDIVTFDFSQPWPTSSALASNPAACAAGEFVTDTDANGTLTCNPALENLLDDTTPDLGGNLNLKTFALTLDNPGAASDTKTTFSRTNHPPIVADVSAGSPTLKQQHKFTVFTGASPANQNFEAIRQWMFNGGSGTPDNPIYYSEELKDEYGFRQAQTGNAPLLRERNWDYYFPVYEVPVSSVSGTFTCDELVTFSTGAKGRLLCIATGSSHGANGTEGADNYRFCRDTYKGTKVKSGGACTSVTGANKIYLISTVIGESSGTFKTFIDVLASGSITGDTSSATATTGAMTRLVSTQGIGCRITNPKVAMGDYDAEYAIRADCYEDGPMLDVSDDGVLINSVNVANEATLEVQEGTVKFKVTAAQGDAEWATRKGGGPAISGVIDFNNVSGDTGGGAIQGLVLNHTMTSFDGTQMHPYSGIEVNTVYDGAGDNTNTYGSGSHKMIGLKATFPSDVDVVEPTQFYGIDAQAVTNDPGTNFAWLKLRDSGAALTAGAQNLIHVDEQSNSGRGGNIHLFNDEITKGGHFAFGASTNSSAHLGFDSTTRALWYIPNTVDGIPNDGDTGENLWYLGMVKWSSSAPVDSTDKCVAARAPLWIRTGGTPGVYICSADDTWTLAGVPPAVSWWDGFKIGLLGAIAASSTIMCCILMLQNRRRYSAAREPAFGFSR